MRYPVSTSPTRRTPKTLAMLDAARRGPAWSPSTRRWRSSSRPTAADPAPGEPIGGERTLHGKPRTTCRLVGECDLGCNYGAKNTLDHTYLTLAQRGGRDTADAVRGQDDRPRRGGGYEVGWVRRDGSGGESLALRARGPASCCARARSGRHDCCCATARACPG